MSTSVDTMKNFFNVLKLYSNDTTTDGITILDEAVRTTTHFAGLQDAVNNFIKDMAANMAATFDPYQTISLTCGIEIGAMNDLIVDTGSASGYYLGNGVVKDAQSIVPEPNVDLTQLSLPEGGSTVAHSYTGADGQTFNYSIKYPPSVLYVVDVVNSPRITDSSTGEPFLDSTQAPELYLEAGTYYVECEEDGNIIEGTARLGEDVAQAIVTMTKGVENFWADGAFKLIYDSFGLDFNGKTLMLTFGVNQSSAAETGPAYGDPAHDKGALAASTVEMIINSVEFTPMDPSNVNGNTYVPNGNMEFFTDRLVAHELTHAVMQANGLWKDNMPQFFTEGVAEFVHGTADYNGGRTLLMLNLATDPQRLTEALSFKSGTGARYAYPAGYMFMSYLCNQSLPTQVSIGTGTAPETFTYTGGEEIISGAADGSQGNFASGIGLIDLAANADDIFVFTTAGNLIIRDARGKLYNAANESGDIVGRSYLATDAGIVDGRIFGEYEFICGANNEDNTIYAGNGGAKLWGGSYGNDNLFGGNGADEFVAGVGCGSDVVNNANSNDVINLAATTLEQITGINATSSGIEMTFSDGSTLNVVGSQNTNFQLGDGSAYTYNSGTWTKTA